MGAVVGAGHGFYLMGIHDFLTPLVIAAAKKEIFLNTDDSVEHIPAVLPFVENNVAFFKSLNFLKEYAVLTAAEHRGHAGAGNNQFAHDTGFDLLFDEGHNGFHFMFQNLQNTRLLSFFLIIAGKKALVYCV